MTRTRAVLAALAASLALVLTGCIGPFAPIGPMGQHIDNLGGVRFAQSQAVPGFDDSTYTLSDEQVGEFKDLLRTHGIDPGGYTTPDSAGCTGGITTRAQLWFFGGGDNELIIDGCAALEGTFEEEATAFFSAIREGGPAGDTLPNSDITAVTFSQSQAIEGFDTREYTQEAPQQIARFVELLDADGVVWSAGVDPELAGEPCPGAITTEITAAYAGTDLVVGPVVIGGCSDVSFADDLTALFAEWREELAG